MQSVEPITREEVKQIVREVVEEFVRKNELRAKELSLLEKVVRVNA
ncbi:MAG: hypothetical protein ACK4Y7_04680 [Caldimicrobium sp.]